jgi:hypothetical protein
MAMLHWKDGKLPWGVFGTVAAILVFWAVAAQAAHEHRVPPAGQAPPTLQGRAWYTPGDVKGRTKLVEVNEDGSLTYHPWSPRGDILPDFSHCGYEGGGVPLPGVPVKIAIEPVEDDNRAHIQEAIDAVGAMPMENGFRGAVLLKKGVYPVEGTLRIRRSGVVLRGEGDNADGTVLIATQRARHTLIEIVGGEGFEKVDGSETAIVDEYVPVGARTFTVDNPKGLRVGQEVIVHRPATAEWISELKMDRIPPHPTGRPSVQWTPEVYGLDFFRVIIAIDDDRITVDVPMVIALDEQYGGGRLWAYRWPDRLAHCGVEGIRAVSEFDETVRKDTMHPWEYTDEDHAWRFVSIDNATNCWVRDCTALHFAGGCVRLEDRATYCTVADSLCLDPVSLVRGSRRYAFSVNGQLNLVRDCGSRLGRHDYVTGARTCGPNVFLRSWTVGTYLDCGPHHRWTVGTLYESLVINGGELNVQDRRATGTGHGWAGAMQVFWNCRAEGFICQKPPTSQNFAIGCKGKRLPGAYAPEQPDGWWESSAEPGEPVSFVEPASLYEAQLRARRRAAAK